MTDTERAIQALRTIEGERELTDREERSMVGLLKCSAEDRAERAAATRRSEIKKRLRKLGARIPDAIKYDEAALLELEAAKIERDKTLGRLIGVGTAPKADRNDYPPRLPFPAQCSHYPGGAHCPNNGEVWLYGPDGARVPGGPICKSCADACVTEYAEKLGEVWTTRPVEILNA